MCKCYSGADNWHVDLWFLGDAKDTERVSSGGVVGVLHTLAWHQVVLSPHLVLICHPDSTQILLNSPPLFISILCWSFHLPILFNSVEDTQIFEWHLLQNGGIWTVVKYAFISAKIGPWWLKNSFQQPTPLLSLSTLFVSISHLTGLLLSSLPLITIWFVSAVQWAPCRMSVHCYFLSREQGW